MKRVVLFAGTTEGRLLAEALAAYPVSFTACVATEYGRERLGRHPNMTVHTGRLDREGMAALLRQSGAQLVIDATHPYADRVTDNLRRAAEETGVPYRRLLRPQSGGAHRQDGVITVDSLPAAVAWLAGRQGPVLASTGSKELDAYTSLPDYRRRVYVRVLPTPESLERCMGLGFDPAHILAMQGPFSTQLNRALLRQWQIETLVTKDSGRRGGFEEKRLAAAAEGVTLLVIGRPRQEQGLTLDALLKELDGWLAEGDGLSKEKLFR